MHESGEQAEDAGASAVVAFAVALNSAASRAAAALNATKRIVAAKAHEHDADAPPIESVTADRN